MYTPEKIVARINERIAEIGMSKTEFYKQSGVSSASLSQWNTGKSYPSLRKLRQIAECLNITFEELTGAEIVIGEEKAPQDELAGLREDQLELVEMIRGFNSRQCREVYNLIEAAMKLSDNK